MCTTCRWSEVVTAIEAHLERRVIDHAGLILATASDVIQANEHVTDEQRKTVAAVIENREGALS